eukprot:TRINITY_DN12596_c0_g1_i1.p2 TRINITY_DN12596_c0_g1~~TRINITY_DN12596_c0_g1_i1.p2  ORF type:complete len:512 (+),score=50.29 TRINITY_DN12596_c0_g1_i1:1763-3298(+)
MFEAAKIVIQLDHEMQPIWSGDDVVGSITVSAERAITIHEVVPSLKANLTVKVFAIGSASETIHSRVGHNLIVDSPISLAAGQSHSFRFSIPTPANNTPSSFAFGIVAGLQSAVLEHSIDVRISVKSQRRLGKGQKTETFDHRQPFQLCQNITASRPAQVAKITVGEVIALKRTLRAPIELGSWTLHVEHPVYMIALQPNLVQVAVDLSQATAEVSVDAVHASIAVIARWRPTIKSMELSEEVLVSDGAIAPLKWDLNARRLTGELDLRIIDHRFERSSNKYRKLMKLPGVDTNICDSIHTRVLDVSYHLLIGIIYQGKVCLRKEASIDMYRHYKDHSTLQCGQSTAHHGHQPFMGQGQPAVYACSPQAASLSSASGQSAFNLPPSYHEHQHDHSGLDKDHRQSHPQPASAPPQPTYAPLQAVSQSTDACAHLYPPVIQHYQPTEDELCQQQSYIFPPSWMVPQPVDAPNPPKSTVEQFFEQHPGQNHLQASQRGADTSVDELACQTTSKA